MTYVKIEEDLYEASIKSIPADCSWDNRPVKVITPLDPEVVFLFRDDIPWYIVERHEEPDPEDPEKTITVENVTDCSEYDVLGDIVQQNIGINVVKMGKTTELEEAYELLYGGK